MMGLFKRILGTLGLAKYEPQQARDQEEGDNVDANDGSIGDRVRLGPIPGAPRKGFGVPVQVAVERPYLSPLIIPCDADGGVQGLKWHAKRLKIDDDEDVADEFFEQDSDDAAHSSEGEPKTLPKFQVKYIARPAKLRNQVMSADGKLQHSVDCRGRLLWV